MVSEELVKLQKAQEAFKHFCAKEKDRTLIIQRIMKHIYELAEFSKSLELNRQIFVEIKKCLHNIMHALQEFKIVDTFLTTNINEIAEYLFQHFTNICIKALVLKFLIATISNLSKRNEKLGHVFMNSGSLLSLFDLIKFTGSYEIQLLTLKMLVKLYGLNTLKERIVERAALFPIPRVFVAIEEKHLDRDLRLYLNQVNLMLKNVYSIEALMIKIEVEPLKFVDVKGTKWVDFNTLDKEISFDCGDIILDSSRNNRLERLYFQSYDIEKYWIRLRESRYVVIFKLNKPCFSETIQFSNSLKDGMKIEYYFPDSEILQNLLEILPSFAPIRTESGRISGFTKNVYRPSRVFSSGKRGKLKKDTTYDESIFNISKSSKSDLITISDSDEYETAKDFLENKKESRTVNTKEKDDFKNLNIHTAKKSTLDIDSNTGSKNMTVSRPVCSNKLKTYSKDIDSDSSIDITAGVYFNTTCIVHQEKDAVIKNKIQNQQEVDVNSERFDASLIVKLNQCKDIVERLASKKRDIRNVSVDSTHISAGTDEPNGSENVTDESLILAQISPVIEENKNYEETEGNENEFIEKYQAQSIDLSGSFISPQISSNESSEKLQHLSENTNISLENAFESCGINKSQNDHPTCDQFNKENILQKHQSQPLINENSPKNSQLDKDFNNVIKNKALNNFPASKQTNKINLLYEDNSQKLINENGPKNNDLTKSFNKVISHNDFESCDKNKSRNASPIGEQNSPKNNQLNTSFDNYIKDLTGQQAQSLLNEISSQHSELDHQSSQLTNETNPQNKVLNNIEQDHDEPLPCNSEIQSIRNEELTPKLITQQCPDNKNKPQKRLLFWSPNKTSSLQQKIISSGDNTKRQKKCPKQQRPFKKKTIPKSKIQKETPQKQLVINLNRMDINKTSSDNDLVRKSDDEITQSQAKKVMDSILSQSTVCLTQNVENYTKDVPSSGSQLSGDNNDRVIVLQNVILKTSTNTTNITPRQLSEDEGENEELVNILSRENRTKSNALDDDETLSRKRKLSEMDDENGNILNVLSQEKDAICEPIHESTLTKTKAPEIVIEKGSFFDTFIDSLVNNDICNESDKENENHKSLKSRNDAVKSISKEKDKSDAPLVKTRTLFNPDDISYLNDTVNPENEAKNSNLQASKINRKVVEKDFFGRQLPIRILSGSPKNTKLDIEKNKPAKKNKTYKNKMPQESYSTKMLNSILRPSSLKPKRTKNGFYSKRNSKTFRTRLFTLSDESDQEQCKITYNSILGSLKNTCRWDLSSEEELAENEKKLFDLEIDNDLTSILGLVTRKLDIATKNQSKYVPFLRSIERTIRKAFKEIK